MANDPSFASRNWTLTSDAVDIRLFDSIWEVLRARILELTIHNCPAYFFITLPQMESDSPRYLSAWQAGGGRSFDRDDARNAAIFEAIERCSLITTGEDDPRTFHNIKASKPAFSDLEWLNYSAKQLLSLRANMKNTSSLSCVYPVNNLWIKATRYGKTDTCALPAVTVLFGEDSRLGWPPVFSTSTGAALRDSVRSATTHAVYELIERDLVALWWYNRLPAPRLCPDAARAALPPAFADWLADRKRITWHLVLPSDLPATTIVALSARRDGSAPAIGAASAPDPAAAVRSATLEVLQGEIALAHMRAAQKGEAPPPVPPLLAWSANYNALATPYLAGSGSVQPLPAPTDETVLAEHLLAHGIDVYIADLTRPEFRVPVVKAVSPHLRDWLPRFGPGRLYDVPVSLGLRTAPTPEDALNPVPFVI